MFIITAFAVSFLLALGLTGWLMRKLAALQILDKPNERSSHSAPVPRGGGLAILAAMAPATLWLAALPHHEMFRYGWLLAGLVLVAIVSWQDDKKGVPAGIRLATHILAAGLSCLFWPQEQTLFHGAMPLWLDRAITAAGWAWFMNLYNFMDGIDGITGIETTSIALGVALCATVSGANSPGLALLTTILTAACLGFLVFNWHPAKIFLGDIGSVPLGYLTGLCLLTLAMRGQWVAAAILPMYYIADSGLTLARRALRGEKIWQAHREHFYQKAAASWNGRHDKVVHVIAYGNLGLIALAATASSANGAIAQTALLIPAFAVTAMLLKKLGSRT